jgi:hypothetical protein
VRTRLVRNESRAKKAFRLRSDLIQRFRRLDAAGLAPPAGMNLRLDHPHRATQIARRLNDFIWAESGLTERDRNA